MEFEEKGRAVRSLVLAELLDRKTFVSLLAVCLLVLSAGFPTILEAVRAGKDVEADFVRQLLQKGLGADSLRMAAPVLAAIPATGAFLTDLQTARIRLVLPRCGRGAYILGRIVSGICAGGVVFLLGLPLAWLLLWLGAFPFMKPADGVLSISAAELWSGIFFQAVCGSIWNLAGTAISLAVGSSYGAVIGPFVLCYAGKILCGRYFQEIYMIDPDKWLEPAAWPLGDGSRLLWLMLLLGILAGWIASLGAGKIAGD